MASLRGRALGGYQLGEQLGGGGIAEVYHARPQKAGGREAVVKVIYPEFAQQPGFLPRFRHIAQQWARLVNHPHILPLLASGEESGYAYLVMPFVQAGSLREWLGKGNRLGAEDAAPFFRQLCDALGYAHSMSVAHGNVKPSNIFLFEGRHVLLGDFGLLWDVSQMDLDHAGSGADIFEYMAPEVVAGRVTQQSDIYSVGAILFATLTGAPPFRGATPREVIAELQRQAPPSLAQISGSLPPSLRALDGVLQRALAKRPEERFPSATALAQAIEETIRRAPASPAASPPGAGALANPFGAPATLGPAGVPAAGFPAAGAAPALPLSQAVPPFPSFPSLGPQARVEAPRPDLTNDGRPGAVGLAPAAGAPQSPTWGAPPAGANAPLAGNPNASLSAQPTIFAPAPQLPPGGQGRDAFGGGEVGPQELPVVRPVAGPPVAPNRPSHADAPAQMYRSVESAPLGDDRFDPEGSVARLVNGEPVGWRPAADVGSRPGQPPAPAPGAPDERWGDGEAWDGAGSSPAQRSGYDDYSSEMGAYPGASPDGYADYSAARSGYGDREDERAWSGASGALDDGFEAGYASGAEVRQAPDHRPPPDGGDERWEQGFTGEYASGYTDEQVASGPLRGEATGYEPAYHRAPGDRRPFSATQLGLPRLTSPELGAAPPSWEALVEGTDGAQWGGGEQWSDQRQDAWGADSFNLPAAPAAPRRMTQQPAETWGDQPAGQAYAPPPAPAQGRGAGGRLDTMRPDIAPPAGPIDSGFDDDRVWTVGTTAVKRRRAWPRRVALLLALLLIVELLGLAVIRPDICPISACAAISSTVHAYVPALGPNPTATPSSLTLSTPNGPLSVQANYSANSTLTLTNATGGAVEWKATTDTPWVTVDPAGGALNANASVPLTLTAKPTGVKPGSYTVTLTVTAGQQTARVPITVKVTTA